MGDPVVNTGRREAFPRSRWRTEQFQDDEAVEASLRERLGQAGEADTTIETLREALILLEARLEEERTRRIAAEAHAAFVAAQLEQQTPGGLSGKLKRLAGR